MIALQFRFKTREISWGVKIEGGYLLTPYVTDPRPNEWRIQLATVRIARECVELISYAVGAAAPEIEGSQEAQNAHV